MKYERFTERELRELKSQNLFRQEYLDDERFEQIVRELSSHPVESRDIRGIDTDNKPRVTAGLAICYQCRMIYWITPSHDVSYYPNEKKAYCELCTMADAFEKLRGKKIERIRLDSIKAK